MTLNYSNNHKGKGRNYDINIIRRQQQVILLIGQGYSLKEISDKLQVSYDTIIEDKKAITKAGLKFLNSIGNKEISFYYQGIMEDMNNIKKDLWSILKNTKDTRDDPINCYYPKDKIQAYKVIKECNTELREIFKEAISLFTIEQQDKRLKRLEQLAGINEDKYKRSYFNQGLPRLENNEDLK